MEQRFAEIWLIILAFVAMLLCWLFTGCTTSRKLTTEDVVNVRDSVVYVVRDSVAVTYKDSVIISQRDSILVVVDSIGKVIYKEVYHFSDLSAIREAERNIEKSINDMTSHTDIQTHERIEKAVVEKKTYPLKWLLFAPGIILILAVIWKYRRLFAHD